MKDIEHRTSNAQRRTREATRQILPGWVGLCRLVPDCTALYRFTGGGGRIKMENSTLATQEKSVYWPPPLLPSPEQSENHWTVAHRAHVEAK